MLKISWSRLRVHTECKQKGMLQRAGKGASLANTRLYFPGTVTDRVVRDWLADDPYKNPNLMPEMVREILDREEKAIKNEGKKMIWKDAADKDSVVRDCIEAVTKIEPHLNELVLPFEYDVDYGFKTPLDVPHPNGGHEQIFLTGFMDIIVRDPADELFSVYDVKHTRDNDYWRHTRGQLSFYDFVVLLQYLNGTKEVGLLQPLAKEQFKPFVMTEDDRTTLLTSIVRMAEDIWRENFPYQTSDPSLCTFCDVKHACSKWKPVFDSNGRKRMGLLKKGA